MPYRLSIELTKLMELTVDVEIGDPVKTDLGKDVGELPDRAMDLIDRISAFAKELFNHKTELTLSQKNILAKKGFSVEFNQSSRAGHRGNIRTEKGYIRF